MSELLEYRTPEYENAKVLVINGIDPCTKETFDLYDP